MKLEIDNTTHWSTSDVRRMVRAALRSYGLRRDKRLSIRYSRQGRVSGWAYLGHPTRGHEGREMRLLLPKPGDNTDMAYIRAEAAMVVEHEVAHLYGMTHRTMPPAMMGSHVNRPLPEWLTDDMLLRWEPPVVVPVSREDALERAREAKRAKAAKSAATAMRRLTEHEAAIERHTRLAAKWRAKVAYYRRQGHYDVPETETVAKAAKRGSKA